MPKIEIDYSNTIIYKISCKEPSITDLYVGHTTNFVQRKHAHKQSCINEKATNYNCKLYEFIRNNGGWDKWKMEIVGFFECNDHYEARKKEQEFFISLNATLNSIEPFPKPKPKNIENNKNIIIKEENSCDINCKTEDFKFNCKSCDFNTYNKKDYTRHLSTDKHIGLTNSTIKPEKIPSLNCICGKSYKHLSSLCAHKKKCTIDINTEKQIVKNETSNNDKLVEYLIKENQELKNLILEIIKKDTKSDIIDK